MTPSPSPVIRVAELGSDSMTVVIVLGCIIVALLIALLVRGLR